MDSIQRQGQNNPNHGQRRDPHGIIHQQVHASQAQDAQNISHPGYQFPSSSSVPHEDDFNAYFNDDGGTGFNPATWDPAPIIDPRLQQNGFTQPSSSWDQSSHHASHPVHTPIQAMQSNDFSNAFNRNPNVYNGFQGYGAPQYSPYTNSPYHQPLSYGPNTFMNPATFAQSSDHGFGVPNAQAQTISPSALQSFPNHYTQFQGHTESGNTGGRNVSFS